ncbi:MAG TPA: LysR family transcriptional regulator [Kofleriaceae bacterium]|jgi:DNA-binding transcriptional LysR family regulator|nr:LysR family transcriptional regulator [Kofleriaceae bacterium]
MAMFSNDLPSIKALQCFVAVARELSFRRASELLNMSQPPLSRQIQGLEDLLRVKLIERTTHSVNLTPAGEAFERDARAILVALDAAVQGVSRFTRLERGDARQVRLGITSAIDFTLLPKLNIVLSRNNDLDLHRRDRMYSKQLIERVRDRRLDLAIIGGVVDSGEQLRVHRVGTEPMITVLPEAHPAASLQYVSFRDLGQMPLFWFPRSDHPSLYDKCERVFAEFQYSARRRPEPLDFTELLALIATGEGVAFCPASMRAASRIGAVYRPFVPEIERLLTIDVQLVVRADEERKEVLDKVEAILAATAG